MQKNDLENTLGAAGGLPTAQHGQRNMLCSIIDKLKLLGNVMLCSRIVNVIVG